MELDRVLLLGQKVAVKVTGQRVDPEHGCYVLLQEHGRRYRKHLVERHKSDVKSDVIEYRPAQSRAEDWRMLCEELASRRLFIELEGSMP
jgi:hypothetical protein